MAFLFAESFGHLAFADETTKWNNLVSGPGTSPTIVSNVRRTGNNGLQASPTTGTSRPLEIVLPASGARFICGFAFVSTTPFNRVGTGTSDSPADSNVGSGTPALFYVRSGTTTQFWFRLNADGTISAYRSATLLGTSSIALQQNVMCYLEFDVTISSSVGAVTVKQNGITTLLSLSNVNTQNAGSATWTTFDFIHASNGNTVGNPTTWQATDLYVLDGSGSTSNAMLGDTRIDLLFPNAAGDETNWTPDSGSNWARVSETTFDGDTSYVAATTAATKDTYKTPTQPVAGANIFAIQLNMLARKTDAGAAGLKPVIRISGTDFLGTEQGIPSAYGDLRQIYDINPSTGVAWVDADIGPTKAQFGIDKST